MKNEQVEVQESALTPADVCPTVKVVNDDDYTVINASDFDAKTMKLFVEKVENPADKSEK